MPERGSYDRATIDGILDEGLICHVGFVDAGAPFVIPTGYGRDGDELLIHGSAASRMMRTLAAGAEACITVTLLDGLVLAESAFHHSMNYRSVVLLGRGRLLGEEEKTAALEKISERLIPGRWAEVRGPVAQELKATTVLAFPIGEASAKLRRGMPGEEEIPHDRPVWQGVLPLSLAPGEPLADPRSAGLEVPSYVRGYRRG
jgi:nitroimidazol reductase NimA-like FMN-containing flavoprotein (pyridoxamine 5'-phosphate oxidase superfamily)